MKDQYINYAPNFSIVVPGGCNAKCAFCFWNENKKAMPSNYLTRLSKVLEQLPDNFKSISLTGGEPTANPIFKNILEVLKGYRNRFERIVLTTNGFMLTQCVDDIDGVVDFVNISRHRVDDLENAEVFKTNTVPNRRSLVCIIKKLNQAGIQVTLSQVLEGNCTTDSVDDYIHFAKRVGASGVFLRKTHGDLDAHPVESGFSNWKATENSCPVCLDKRQVINGMPVAWKRGLLEPSEVGFHELIFQQNGMLSLDWAGNNKIEMSKVFKILGKQQKSYMIDKTVYRGCASGVSIVNIPAPQIASARYGCGVVSGGCSGGCGSGLSSFGGGHCG
jgi:pyruvate-formate lyase-activating enzyme